LFSAGEDWKVLAERLKVANTNVKFYDSRTENPADKVLGDWENQAHSTVGRLYDILVEIGCPVIADLL